MNSHIYNHLGNSANYIWFKRKVLGKGATATVYEGLNKNNGQIVAVKTFTSEYRPVNVQMREFEVLLKVCNQLSV